MKKMITMKMIITKQRKKRIIMKMKMKKRRTMQRSWKKGTNNLKVLNHWIQQEFQIGVLIVNIVDQNCFY
jgi:hypothetical protein